MVKSFSVLSTVEATTKELKKMEFTMYQFQSAVKKLSPAAQKKVIERARVVVKDEPCKACQNCKQIPMMKWRLDRKYCSRACKQKAYRERKTKGVQ